MALVGERVTSLLIINPNSSRSITDGLIDALTPLTPLGTKLVFYTAPNTAPSAITDSTTGIQSANSCYNDIITQDLINRHDGFLVCCFSDHPLTHMLREKTSKPVIGILESAIVQAMLVGQRFGIVTTGTGYKYIHYTEVRNFLGATSERFAGLTAVGLGVVELREGDQQKIVTHMKQGSRQVAEKGADVVVLGCAGEKFDTCWWKHSSIYHVKGMAGMESLIKDGYTEAGYHVPRVVDGTKSGIAILSGLVRIQN